MLNAVTDKIRFTVADLLRSNSGNGLTPVKVLREILGTANDLVGRPFCTEQELVERRAAASKGTSSTPAKREAAPVVVYFDGKDHRTKKKIEELLKGREISFQVCDVTDDESTRSWAQTQAKQSEFPLVFVAGESLGGLHELTQADVNGTLVKRVFG